MRILPNIRICFPSIRKNIPEMKNYFLISVFFLFKKMDLKRYSLTPNLRLSPIGIWRILVIHDRVGTEGGIELGTSTIQESFITTMEIVFADCQRSLNILNLCSLYFALWDSKFNNWLDQNKQP